MPEKHTIRDWAIELIDRRVAILERKKAEMYGGPDEYIENFYTENFYTENIYIDSVLLDAILQSVMTVWGDILFRGVSEAERLAPDAGGGYNFLRSRGAGLSPEWFDIEAWLNDLIGGGNRTIAAFLAIPTPSISPVAVASNQGGGFTDDEALTVPIPTVVGVAEAYTVAAVTGAIADDGGAQTNETTAANEATADDLTLLPATPAENDAYYIGGDAPFDWAVIEISTAGDGTWTMVWEYYDGDSWELLPGISDTSSGFRLGDTRSIAFTRPGDWATATIILEGKYWIRGRISAYTSVVTQPLGQQAWIGTH